MSSKEKIFEFHYDRENDELLLHNNNSKSKGGVKISDIVLDFNVKKELVGI
jgi:hypothetical protein